MENIKETITVQANENDRGKRIDSFLNEVIEDATRSYIQKIIEGYRNNSCKSSRR